MLHNFHYVDIFETLASHDENLFIQVSSSWYQYQSNRLLSRSMLNICLHHLTPALQKNRCSSFYCAFVTTSFLYTYMSFVMSAFVGSTVNVVAVLGVVITVADSNVSYFF